MDILFIFLVGAFICSLFFMSIYLNAAKKLGIIAKVNFRTLHSQETPKGGGIVLSVVYMLTKLVFTLSLILFTASGLQAKNAIHLCYETLDGKKENRKLFFRFF